MSFFGSLFGSSSRSSDRQWYGQSSQPSYSTSSSSSSRRDPYGSSSYSTGSRYREGISEPYYRYTRDDRRYSFGRRQGHSERVRRAEPQGYHPRHYTQPEPAYVSHYSRDPYRSRHPKPYNPNPFRSFDQTTRAGQREAERGYYFGGRNAGYGYGGGSGTYYGERIAMDGRYPRYR